MLVKGETKSGFKFEIEKDSFNNMEFLDAVAATDDGDPMAISKVVTLMLGKQKKALYNHLRLKDGRVPIEKVGEEVGEIFNLVGETEKK